MSQLPFIAIDNCAWEFDGYNDKLEASGLTVLQLTVASATEDAAAASRQIQAAKEIVAADPKKLCVVGTVDEIRTAHEEGRVGIVFHFQNALPIGRDLSLVGRFHELGVRVVQITYNEVNDVGCGCLVADDTGLTAFGRELIAELNRTGILVDLTHVGARTSMEAMEASSAPVTFSHSNARALADNPRNISDEQIEACAALGGVIGACGWGPISWTGSDEPPSIETVADHLSYIADLVGPKHVGIATDGPISHNMANILAHFQEINAAYGSVTGAFVDKFGPNIKHRYPMPISAFPKLAEALRRRGWSEPDVAGALGGNMLDLYTRTWK